MPGCLIAGRISGRRLRAVENLVFVGVLVAIMAWCVGGSVAALWFVQAFGLDADNAMGRAVCAVAALGGLAAALMALASASKWWVRRCDRIKSSG